MKESKSVAHKGPLGGGMPVEGHKDNDYSAENIRNELKEKGLDATEKVIVKNDVTGKSTEIVIRRDGTQESTLILALANPDLTRDQKDSVLSQYLFERGKESASMMIDLMRYKGQHTKESRSFKSQMRFDFEMFVSMFSNYLKSTAKSIFEELEYQATYGLELGSFVKDYQEYLKKGGLRTVGSFMSSLGHRLPLDQAALVATAVRMYDEAETLQKTVEKVTEARMKDKGFGIYIDVTGKPYSVFDKEPLEDVIKADRERIEEIKREEGL